MTFNVEVKLATFYDFESINDDLNDATFRLITKCTTVFTLVNN